jgi:mRNA interferase MazF
MLGFTPFNPTYTSREQEIQKTRPAVVISSEMFSAIPMQIIIPMTT